MLNAGRKVGASFKRFRSGQDWSCDAEFAQGERTHQK